MSGDSPSRQNASMFYGQNDRPSAESIQRLRRDRSPRRDQMFAPGWHGAAQIPVPAAVEINTPRGGMTHEERHATESAVMQLAAGVMSTEERISRLEVHADHTVAAIKNIDGADSWHGRHSPERQRRHLEDGRGVGDYADAADWHAVEFGDV